MSRQPRYKIRLLGSPHVDTADFSVHELPGNLVIVNNDGTLREFAYNTVKDGVREYNFVRAVAGVLVLSDYNVQAA